MNDAPVNPIPPLPAEALVAELLPVLAAGQASIKPGLRTTEFWLMAALVAGIFIGVYAGRISGDGGASLAAASSFAYAVFRFILKQQAQADRDGGAR